MYMQLLIISVLSCNISDCYELLYDAEKNEKAIASALSWADASSCEPVEVHYPILSSLQHCLEFTCAEGANHSMLLTQLPRLQESSILVIHGEDSLNKSVSDVGFYREFITCNHQEVHDLWFATIEFLKPCDIQYYAELTDKLGYSGNISVRLQGDDKVVSLIFEKQTCQDSSTVYSIETVTTESAALDLISSTYSLVVDKSNSIVMAWGLNAISKI